MISLHAFDVLTNHSFLVVAAGTFLLAVAAGAVGCITVLKGQSLIGDAIGHAAFPGIVLAYMLFAQREPVLLLLGAAAAGTVAFSLIQAVHAHTKLKLDAVLAVILSSFFGFGMVLKSYIQGHPAYGNASQSGLAAYIFGQAAYLMEADVRLIALTVFPVLMLLVLFYKEIQVFVFDEVYAKTIGIRSGALQALTVIITMALIAVGLKIVGAVLISSLLIVPAIAALQWSHRFSVVLVLAGAIGGASAVAGTALSASFSGMSTGPTIIVCMTTVALLSLGFGPYGMLAGKRRQGGNA